MISAGEAGYLSSIENQPFEPMGWLYRNIFQELVDKGLAHETARGFVISEEGREALRKHRENP